MDALFSPHPKRDSNHGLNFLAEELKAAKKSLDMALFVFSAQQLTNVLQEKVEQGIENRLVANPGFASGPFSEVLDLLGISLLDHTYNPQETMLMIVSTDESRKSSKPRLRPHNGLSPAPGTYPKREGLFSCLSGLLTEEGAVKF